MEFLLLWVDDLDDAMGALRHLRAEASSASCCALALFAATGFALVLRAAGTLAVIARGPLRPR